MTPRTVAVASELPLPAHAVVDLLTRPATLRFVCWPLLVLPADLPATFAVGSTVELRLRTVAGLPLWRHRITVESAGPEGAQTSERGGPFRVWRHRLEVRPLGDGATAYRDEVTVDAGRATPLTVPLVRAFYRWRHRRWRVLARGLGASS